MRSIVERTKKFKMTIDIALKPLKIVFTREATKQNGVLQVRGARKNGGVKVAVALAVKRQDLVIVSLLHA